MVGPTAPLQCVIWLRNFLNNMFISLTKQRRTLEKKKRSSVLQLAVTYCLNWLNQTVAAQTVATPTHVYAGTAGIYVSYYYALQIL